MNKVLKMLILAIIATIATAESLHGGPVRQSEAIYTQPDGSQFQVKIKGDEWIRIRTTLDGCAIIKDEEGWWCYGVYDINGSLTCSKYRVGTPAPAEIKSKSRNIPYNVLNKAAAARRAVRHQASLTKSQAAKTTKKGIAILAQFPDTKFTYTKEDFHNLLNQKGYNNTGSAKDYYEAQFGEGWEFSFDVSDIITLPNNVKYYGANNPTNGQDSKPAELIRDACREADSAIDFSQYDLDGNKEVDNVYVFVAGHDEAEYTEDTDLIWSHQWYVLSGAGIRLTCDGVTINRYACSSELSGVKDITGIGTFCHEYAHTFGLPDFYDTNYDEDGAWAAGLWLSTSLMDGGNYNNNAATPPNLNCIERKLLGLSDPLCLEADRAYTLEPIHKNGQYYILETNVRGEYFLVECRSNEGWDKYIGGSGMLIYHIDENGTDSDDESSRVSKWKQNTVNTDPLHQCADLIEADQRNDNITNVRYPFNNIKGIFYPQSKISSITADNTPAFKTWGGTKPSASIIGITKSEDNILFNVIQGSEIPVLPDVTGFNYQAFPDAIFISFKSEGTSTPDKAIIEWCKNGESEYEKAIITSDDNKYSLIIRDLESENTLYNIRIRFESKGLSGNTLSTQILTKRSPAVTWPYLYLVDGGNINASEGLIAHVVNASGSMEEEWFLDGQSLGPAKDGVIYPAHSGKLSCIITWEDGSTDTIIKEITVRE
jgi:M6 family metalloprotease-like protein